MSNKKRIEIVDFTTYLLIKSKFSSAEIAKHFSIPIKLVNLDLAVRMLSYAEDLKELPTLEYREQIRRNLIQELKGKRDTDEQEEDYDDLF
jgi:hypothetical protein